MKKIVKLTESDINRIVKKTILKEDVKFSFMDEYSNNLERIEKSYSKSDDQLEAIIDVYNHRISFIKSYLKNKEDKKED
jgi:hypothetical protein|tara:strand:- start:347 stop:583 length:237 start_codon:yes stop_codon:yes gene_type:complete